MSWIFIALAGSAVGAAIHIVDKTVLQNYVKTYVSFLLIIAIFQGLVGLTIVGIFYWFEHITVYASLMAFASGGIFGASGVLFLYVLSTQEVSRTVPVIQTAPVFAAILGLTFLEESLTNTQWLAIVITALGAIMLSRKSDSKKGVFLYSSLAMLLVASFAQAAAQVMGKIPLEDLSIPMTHGFRSLGLSLAMFTSSIFNRTARSDVINMLNWHKNRLAFIAISEIGFVTISFLLFLWAISLSQVGLVTAVYATRSLFVLLYSTLITLGFKELLGEKVTYKTILIKMASVTLIVSGVTLISMPQ